MVVEAQLFGRPTQREELYRMDRAASPQLEGMELAIAAKVAYVKMRDQPRRTDNGVGSFPSAARLMLRAAVPPTPSYDTEGAARRA